MALVFNTDDVHTLEAIVPTGPHVVQEGYESYAPPKKLFLLPGEVSEVPDDAAELMLQKLKVRGLMPFKLTDDKEKVRLQGRRNYFDFVVAYLREVERQDVLAKHQGRLPAPPGPHVEHMWEEYNRLLPEFKHLMTRKGVKAPKITASDAESSELAQAARRMEEADIEFARQAKATAERKAATT